MEPDPRILTFEDFRLDIDRAELWKGTARVSVEPKVLDLVAYLVANGDHVVSRDELIAHVWKGRIVSDAAISSGINAARTALGDTGKAQRLIRTVPRRGFRFVGQLVSGTGPEAEPKAPTTGSGVRYLESFDGTHLAFETVGTGPPLMKAPNFLSHLEFEHTSPVWRHWVQALSRSNTYCRLDQRGNGLSDWDVEDISFNAFVEDLRCVMDALEIERAPIFGLSQGGAIAAQFAHRYPERVSGLIILGGYVAGWRKFGNPELLKRREAMLSLMKVGWGENNPAFRQAYTNLFVPGGSPEQQEWFNAMQRASATPENAFRILDSFGDLDVRPLLPELDVPALILHCREDAIVPFDAGRQFALGLPNARFVALEGSNHILLADDPGWPKFQSELQRFLATL